MRAVSWDLPGVVILKEKRSDEYSLLFLKCAILRWNQTNSPRISVPNWRKLYTKRATQGILFPECGRTNITNQGKFQMTQSKKSEGPWSLQPVPALYIFFSLLYCIVLYEIEVYWMHCKGASRQDNKGEIVCPLFLKIVSILCFQGLSREARSYFYQV